jgi:hypothetical protein
MPARFVPVIRVQFANALGLLKKLDGEKGKPFIGGDDEDAGGVSAGSGAVEGD